MTVKMPGALWVPIKRNYTNRRRSRTDALILHIAVTEAASLEGWFNSPRAYASSHMYVRRDGTIEQYIDLDKISWANAGGNSRSVTVETQGMGSGTWTAAQCKSLAAIASFCNSHYGVPLRLMGNSLPSTRGVGYHRLGVNPWRVAGGETWSKSYGKVCPGGDRIPQIPGIIKAAQGTGGLGAVAPVASKPRPKPPVVVKYRRSKKATTNIQKALQNMGLYKGAIDGLYGPVTEEAVEYYQRHQLFGNLVVDGYWGAKTSAHYVWVKALQRAMNKWKGVNLVVDGDYGKKTKARVHDLMVRNHGEAYKGVIDDVPGAIFCDMLNVKVHP